MKNFKTVRVSSRWYIRTALVNGKSVTFFGESVEEVDRKHRLYAAKECVASEMVKIIQEIAA